MNSIPSCGLTLLRGPRNSFDYVLRVTTDEVQFVKIFCHRCILASHSQVFNTLICGKDFFDMNIKLKPGYIGAFMELVQYMYLKDPCLIHCKNKVLELCGKFEMSLDHFLIRNSETPDTGKAINIHLESDKSICVTAPDFFHIIEITKAKLRAPHIERISAPVTSSRGLGLGPMGVLHKKKMEPVHFKYNLRKKCKV